MSQLFVEGVSAEHTGGPLWGHSSIGHISSQGDCPTPFKFTYGFTCIPGPCGTGSFFPFGDGILLYFIEEVISLGEIISELMLDREIWL